MTETPNDTTTENDSASGRLAAAGSTAPTDDEVMDLLGELHAIGRDIDEYEYGLPVYMVGEPPRVSDHTSRLIDAVRVWLSAR